MKRVAVVFDNFGPYHVARLTGAAAHCDLLAVEVAARSAEYPWDATEDVSFERVRLFGSDRAGASDPRALFERLSGVFREHAVEVVAIPGWSGRHAFAALRAASRLGAAVVVMSESQARDFARRTASEFVKRRYVALCQAALVGGQRHRDYMTELGLEPDAVFLGYDVVDNAFIAAAADRARLSGDRLRQQAELPARYFLASARFIPKKNLERLILAFAGYWHGVGPDRESGGERCQLVILGDGALRPGLEALISQLKLTEAVHLPGFRQYAELPAYYGLAEAFVHASTTEQWGLVVNEAMAAGLPVLVSDACGCAPDLVEVGRNGFVFAPEDVEALTALLVRVGSAGTDRTAMGEASRQIIARWSPDTFGRGLADATARALAAPRPRRYSFDRMLLWALARR